MTEVLIAVFIIFSLLTSFVPWIVGAVLTRRAAKRWAWPEARLAFIAFLALPILALSTVAVFPLVDRIGGGIVGVDSLRWASGFYAVANGAAIIAISLAIYRLAKRGALANDGPPIEPHADVKASLETEDLYRP